MKLNEESFKAWEQDHIDWLTSRQMGEWLYRRDMNARPQAEWNYNGFTYSCSNCGKTPKTLGFCGSADFMAENFKFCPNCGADMRGKKNETDN